MADNKEKNPYEGAIPVNQDPYAGAVLVSADPYKDAIPAEPTEEESRSIASETWRTFGGAARDLSQGIIDLAQYVGPDGPGIVWGDDPTTAEVESGVRFTADTKGAKARLPKVPEPETFGLPFVRDITQFAVPFSKAKYFTPATIPGKVLEATTRGAVIEQAAFSPYEQRISNLVQSYPSLQNPVTEYLQADPSDTEATARFKMALEGAAISLPLDTVIENVAKARARRKTAEGQKQIDEQNQIEIDEKLAKQQEDTQEVLPLVKEEGYIEPAPKPKVKKQKDIKTKRNKETGDIEVVIPKKLTGTSKDAAPGTYAIRRNEAGFFEAYRYRPRTADEINKVFEKYPLYTEDPKLKRKTEIELVLSKITDEPFATQKQAQNAIEAYAIPARLPKSLKYPLEPSSGGKKLQRVRSLFKGKIASDAPQEIKELFGNPESLAPVYAGGQIGKDGTVAYDMIGERLDELNLIPPQIPGEVVKGLEDEIVEVMMRNDYIDRDAYNAWEMNKAAVERNREILEFAGFDIYKMKDADVSKNLEEANKIYDDALEQIEYGKRLRAQEQEALQAQGPIATVRPEEMDVPPITEIPPGWVETTDSLSKINEQFIESGQVRPKVGSTFAEETVVPGAPGEASSVVTSTKKDLAGNINLNRIDAPAEFYKVLKETADEYDGFKDARRGVVKMNELEKLAEESGISLEDILKRKTGVAFNAESVHAARLILLQSTKQVVKMSKDIASKGANNLQIMQFEQALARHAAIQEQIAGITAEAGRALRSFKEIVDADGKFQEKLVIDYIKARGGKETIEEIASGIAKLDNQKQVNQFVKDAYSPTFTDYVQEFWINALLSSPSTHFVNISSNSLVALTRPFEYALAAAMGLVRSGPDKITFTEAAGRFAGTIFGTVDGLIAGGRALADPETVSDPLTKLELRRQKAIPGVIGETVRLPGRALVAEDVFFKAIGYRQELWGLAIRQAKKEGKGMGRAFEIMKDPKKHFPDIHIAATEAGRYQTFTQPLGEGKVGYLGSLTQKAIGKLPWLRYVMPFVRTPVNIVRYAGERTPLGVFSTTYKEAIQKGGAEADLARAKVTLGTGVMATVAFYANNGEITGRGPSDPRERAVLMETGWQPYSIKIGDTYYAYNRFEPVGILFGVAADTTEIFNYVEEQGTKEEKIEADRIAAMMIASVTENLINKTFLTGLSDAVKVIHDSDRYGDAAVQRFFSSFVPTFVYYQRRGEDPYLRDVQTMADAFANRVSGKIGRAVVGKASEDLPLKRNVLGEARMYAKGLGGKFSPLRESEIKQDIVFDEFVSLGFTPSIPKRDIRGVKLNSDQYSKLMSLQLSPQKGGYLDLRGQLEQIITSPGYQSLPTYAKREALADIIRSNQEAAREIMAGVLDGSIVDQFIQQRMQEIQE